MTEEQLIRSCVVRFEIVALYMIAIDVKKYRDLKWKRGMYWPNTLKREANGWTPNYIQ